jgi:hypothetical protein
MRIGQYVILRIQGAFKSGGEMAEHTFLTLFFESLNPLPIGSRTWFAPGVIRTHNLLIRSQMLYPIELRVRKDRQASAKALEVKRTGNDAS